MLASLKVEIISTGGTSRLLRSNGIAVREVSDLTGFPEILDGRVKTLSPRIAGGLLAIRNNSEHMKQVAAHEIPLIDLVCVNLYPFVETIRRSRNTCLIADTTALFRQTSSWTSKKFPTCATVRTRINAPGFTSGAAGRLTGWLLQSRSREKNSPTTI